MRNTFRMTVFCFILLFLCSPKNFYASGKLIDLDGMGTYENPYRIENVDDFTYFRDLVNSGNDFSGKFFLQEANLDLCGIENWEPIGVFDSGHYFYGIYNGNGYSISNLTIDRPEDNAGLFGQLGGTVYNLGIESGSINSACSGSITSHSVGDNALILNCYNRASVNGIYRAGGIADNFSAGNIINCWNLGAVESNEISAGIISYDAAAIIRCESIMDNAVNYDTLTGEIIEVSTISLDSYDEMYKVFQNQIGNGSLPLKQAVACLLKGKGTEELPYLINDVKGLCIFRILVNAGNSFSGEWVRQNADIDLDEIGYWKAIGIFGTERYFQGIYDGNGHTISNLRINEERGNVGFFGQLAGTVLNLGIESGNIQGDCVGAIASHSSGNPMIINCYNKADLIGNSRAGGIADNFQGGVVANCYNTGIIEAPISANIVSYSATRVFECHYFYGEATSDEFIGVEEKSNYFLNNLQEIAEALNESLYRVCTKTGFQRNNLVCFNKDGSFAGQYNYKLHYFGNALFVIALICMSCCLGVLIIFRKKNISLSEISQYLLSSHYNLGEKIFVIIYAVCILLMAVGYICGDHTITRTFIWSEGEDALMDFFNPLKAILNNNYSVEGFYSENGGAYPPIARGILWICGQFFSYRYTIGDAFGLRSNSEGIILWMLVFTLVSICIYCTYKKEMSQRKKIVIFALIFSYPMLNIFERGNIIIIAYALVLLYSYLYDSPKSSERMLAYIFLGIAAAIKIYPAVFGLAVVATGNKKEILKCVLCGGAIFFIPFAFVGGWPALAQYLVNVTSSSVHSFEAVPYYLNFTNVIGLICENIGISINGIQHIIKYVLWILVIALAIETCVCREKYKSWLAMVLIMVLLPGFSCTYMTVYYILPLIFLLKKEHLGLFDIISLVIMIFMIVPLNFLTGTIGVNREQIWVFMGVSGIFLALLFVVDTIVNLKRTLEKKVV